MTDSLDITLALVFRLVRPIGGEDTGQLESDSLLEFLADQPFRSYKQHQDDNQERERVLERDGDEAAGPGFSNSQDEASHDSAGQAVEPAKDCRRETLEKRFEHKEWVEDQCGC